MIKLRKTTKSFSDNIVLDDVDFVCPDTGIVLINGENGSGKTTLLNILDFMDEDFSGEYCFFGQNSKKIKDRKKAYLRSEEISYVFQKHNLVTYLSKDENLSINSMIKGGKTDHSKNQDWHSLSQGQQEIIALENGLKEGKKLYLLDEVTANLDSFAQKQVVKRIECLSKNSLVIVVSHDINLEDLADFVWRIDKGHLVLTKGNIDQIKQSSLEIKKDTKKSFFPLKLMAKRTKKDWFIHSLSIIACSFVFLLGWLGISACKGYSLPYLKSAMEKETYISIQSNNDFTEEKIYDRFYPNAHIQYSGPIVYSDKVPDDGYVHCNNHIKDYYEDYFNELGLGLAVDNSIQENLAYLYSKNNGLYSRAASSDMNYYIQYKQNCWNVNGSLGLNYASNNGFQLNIANRKFYESNYGKLDIELEDDTFYTTNTDMISKEKTDFDFMPSSYINSSEPDFNDIFPDGITTKLCSLKNSWLVLVSDNSMDKIAEKTVFKSDIVVKLNTDRDSIINYCAANNIAVDFIVPKNTSDDQLNKYRKIISHNTYKSSIYGYSIFIYAIPIIGLIFESIAYFSMQKFHQRDDWILKSKGLSKNKALLISIIPSSLSVLLSLLFGYGLFFMVFNYAMTYEVFSFPPLYSVLWGLIIIFAQVIINIIINLRLEKND